MAKDVLITPASGKIEFSDSTLKAKIYELNGNLYIDTLGNTLILGDGTAANIEIGDIGTVTTLTMLGGGDISSNGNILTIGLSGDTVNLNESGVNYLFPSSLITTSTYTANDILTKIKTVDGSGSGLDADLLDGQHGSYYQPQLNGTGFVKISGTTITYDNSIYSVSTHSHGNIAGNGSLSGLDTTPGSGDYILLADVSNDSIIVKGPIIGSSTSTYLRNDGTWATPVGTTYTASSGLSLVGTVFSHADTSSASNISSSNSNGTVIQSISVVLDTYGHVTTTSTGLIDLDGRYYTETESDARFLNLTGGTLTGPLIINKAVAGDGGWDDAGLIIKNNDATAGEAAVSFQNSATTTNYWITGLNQGTDLKFCYSTSFNDASTKLTLDINGDLWYGNKTYRYLHTNDTATANTVSKVVIRDGSGNFSANDLTINGLILPNTTTATSGVIFKSTDRFIHNFQHPTGGGGVPTGRNTFVGVGSGNFTMGSTATANYFSSYNTAIGWNSLFSNTTGYANNAFGSSALTLNTTGIGNMSFGTFSLQKNTTGNYNIGIGMYSLVENVDGSNNIGIGYSAGQLGVSVTRNTAVGDYAMNSNVAGSAGVAIGADAQRYVNSTATPWTNTNTAVGYGALRGSSTAANNTGSSNTALGYNAMFNYTTTTQSVGVGYQSMYNITTGTRNVSIGHASFFTNNTGEENTIIGAASMYSVVGSRNSTLGADAGRYYGATGTTSVTGVSDSIYIGRQSRASANSVSNEIVIGNGAVGSGSNTVTIGASTNTRNVFIGTIETNSSIKVGNDSSTASAANAGSFRYRTDGSTSYLELCMQTGASSYQWYEVTSYLW